jgi:hypothetical protein
VNEFDVLEDLERELGPSLRVALHRAADRVTGESAPNVVLIADNADRQAREHESAAATLVDVRPRAVRPRRRRWLVAAAAALVVVVTAVTVLVRQAGDPGIRTRVPAGPDRRVTTVPPTPTSASTQPGFAALMLTERAAPSIPKTGKLVASLYLGGDRGAYHVFADGRLILLDQLTGSSSWTERRLTPEGVERVRDAFLATGLFDPQEEEPPTEPPPPPRLREIFPARDGVAFCVCVRVDGRFLARHARELSPEETVLRNRLAALPSSLAPTDWVDQQSKAYVPSKYAVCFVGRGNTAGPDWTNPDPTIVLPALPARAVELLGGRRGIRDFAGRNDCFELTTAWARALATELVDEFGPPEPGGPETWMFEIDADVHQPNLEKLGIQFTQLLPDGNFASHGG